MLGWCTKFSSDLPFYLYPISPCNRTDGSFVIVHYSATSNLDIVTGRDIRLLD